MFFTGATRTGAIYKEALTGSSAIKIIENITIQGEYVGGNKIDIFHLPYPPTYLFSDLQGGGGEGWLLFEEDAYSRGPLIRILEIFFIN